MVEYGLLVALIAVTVVAGGQIVGLQISTVFSKIGVYIAGARIPPSP